MATRHMPEAEAVLREFTNSLKRMERRLKRTVIWIETDCSTASVTCELGCGHKVTFHIADHPVKSIESFGVELGDELDCYTCEPPAVH